MCDFEEDNEEEEVEEEEAEINDIKNVTKQKIYYFSQQLRRSQ